MFEESNSENYIKMKPSIKIATTLTDWNMCFVIMGQNAIISKIAVVRHISLEQDLQNCIVMQGDQSQLFPLPAQITWDDSGRFRLLIDREPSIKDMKLILRKVTILP